MVQLSTILWMLIVLFAIVGALRGWTRELVSTAGIILALFATWQFDAVLLQPLTRGATPEQIFFLYSGILVVISFFAYQAPTNIVARRQPAATDQRQGVQERLLGLVLGGVNGYLIFGSIWYYLDRTGYPFAPYVFAPTPGSASAAMVESLPLIFLVQGNLLTVLVIVLFLLVLIAVI
ncbi:MAG: CvpA family protein [Chloroflexi bacterium]|jgi:uncharacterized membrane protein required for colicin V production|nr:CvpA family protein [Chloroflexota bacterium]